MHMKNFLRILVISALGGMITLGTYLLFFEQKPVQQENNGHNMPVFSTASYRAVDAAEAAETTDFTEIAERSVHAVVHVKNLSVAPSGTNPLLEFFYGPSARSESQVVGTGSGVIISSDGYIVTNNHVIQGARKLEITTNNRETFEAEVIGADESTDIALIKINK